MVTVEDLKDWEYENGENAVMDGPYRYSFEEEQWNEFGQTTFDKLNDEYGTDATFDPTGDDWFETFFETADENEWDVYDGGVGYDIILQAMVDVINKYKIETF